MSGSIQLHPTLGVNPHLTFCRRCGGEAQELMLIGARTSVIKCEDCGLHEYGGGASQPCPKCKSRNRSRIRTIEEREKLPACEPCDKCKAELEEHKKIVEAGGVYFKCKQCNATGVLRETAELSKVVREKLNVEAPNPCGIEFDTCEQHTAK